MYAKIEKLSKNINFVVDGVLHEAKDDPTCEYFDLPTKGECFLFAIKDNCLRTTPVQDLEWSLDKKSLTFWTRNTQYRLTSDKELI